MGSKMVKGRKLFAKAHLSRVLKAISGEKPMNTLFVVWENIEVEGWSRRQVSMHHMVNPHDESFTVCGVPIPRHSVIKLHTEMYCCAKCIAYSEEWRT
jgi:hypothetical protein